MILAHWGWDKMAAIFQTTFWNAFSWMKMYEDFNEVCSSGFSQQFSIIGSDNSLVPTRRQAIVWTNGDYIAAAGPHLW